MMASIQFKRYQPLSLSIRVGLLRDPGRQQDALAAIAEGFDVISESHEHWCDSKLHRVRGELHVSMSRQDEAEAAFTTALVTAREQCARWAC